MSVPFCSLRFFAPMDFREKAVAHILFLPRNRKEEKMSTKLKEETLGQRLKAARIRMGMTQEELASMTFIPKPTLSNYENDRIDIKSSVIVELARALKTDPNYLLLGNEENENDSAFMTEARAILSKITDSSVQEVLLKQLRALV